MAASFKKGDKVRQKMPAPVQGTVVRFGEVEGELGYCILVDETDDLTEKWFRESELVAVPAQDEQVAS